MNVKKKLALGVDIGGSNTAFGLVDQFGELVFESAIPTKNYNQASKLVDAIFAMIQQSGYLNQLIGIGVGAPNGNYYTGSIEFAPNLSWKGIIPLAKLFQEKFKLKTVLTNDANAAALGEMIFGVAKNYQHFVTITLGTGLGSGVVANSKLLYGKDGLAGEFGHIRVVPNGRTCGCGRTGCLETYVSSTGVVRSIQELNHTSKENSILLKIENPSSLDVSNAAQAGDDFAKEIIEFTAQVLGSALADFSCFSNPEAYVLFGGLANLGETFSERVKFHLEENILNIYKDKVNIVISTLQGQNAAILGASALVFEDLKT